MGCNQSTEKGIEPPQVSPSTIANKNKSPSPSISKKQSIVGNTANNFNMMQSSGRRDDKKLSPDMKKSTKLNDTNTLMNSSSPIRLQ